MLGGCGYSCLVVCGGYWFCLCCCFRLALLIVACVVCFLGWLLVYCLFNNVGVIILLFVYWYLSTMSCVAFCVVWIADGLCFAFIASWLGMLLCGALFALLL